MKATTANKSNPKHIQELQRYDGFDSSYQLSICRFMGLNGSHIHSPLAKIFQRIRDEPPGIYGILIWCFIFSYRFLSSVRGTDNMFLLIFVMVVGMFTGHLLSGTQYFTKHSFTLWIGALVNFSVDIAAFPFTFKTLCYPTNKTTCYLLGMRLNSTSFMTKGFIVFTRCSYAQHVPFVHYHTDLVLRQ